MKSKYMKQEKMPSAISASKALLSGRESCCDDDDCLIDLPENDPLIIGGLSDAVSAMLEGGRLAH